jgi:hypothetical protein
VNGHYEDADGNYVTSNGTVSWNNEPLFQATKLIVEISAISSDISLEYADAAFRFGHSQLRDTIDALERDASGAYDLTGAVTQYGLAQAFLVPGQFADIGPTAIALGMSRQVGNETDEFVTPALQQSLLGQPLDLPAINIARGRDLGLPTLNETRHQIHDAIIAERNADPNTPHHTQHHRRCADPVHELERLRQQHDPSRVVSELHRCLCVRRRRDQGECDHRTG